MKFTLALTAASLLATSTLAAPVAAAPALVLDISPETAEQQIEFEAKLAADFQTAAIGTTANEFTNGGCRNVIFFFARGTNQDGNMVSCRIITNL
jgi:cutinase